MSDYSIFDHAQLGHVPDRTPAHQRRPGIEAVAARLLQENPKWTRWQALSEAKKNWLQNPARHSTIG